MEFTEKKLVELLQVSQPALYKGLKETNHELKEVKGSSKKVKHYKLEDLPSRYQDKLKALGIEIEIKKDTNISKANFTQKYLLASPLKQKIAMLKCKLIEFYLKRDNSTNAKQWLKDILFSHMEFDDLGSVSYKQLSDWRVKYLESKAKGLNILPQYVKTTIYKI